MKFVIFRSSKGDCLLISHPDTDGTNKNILIDGGMSTSYKESVAPYLNEHIKEQNEDIDLVCVSHIDDDHIVGILALMDSMADWRVYNYHKKKGNTGFKKPKLPEPPNVLSIWHNSFAKTYDLGSDLPKVEQALHDLEQMTKVHLSDELIRDVHDKAASIKRGITLSQRIRPEQLGIELNPQWKGKLVKCNQRSVKKNTHKIGEIELSVIGPFTGDLNDLKDDWRKWEKKHRAELKDFYSDLNARALSHPIGSTELKNILRSSGSIALKPGEREELRSLESIALTLGEREEVSIPNLASIMFLAKADGRSILMTGDGHADDILKGLKKNKELEDGGLHVDILKIQHHGADANLSETFCKKITADHYVFCGNGTHHNPEIEVLELIFNSRQGSDNQKSGNKEVNRPFKFWLNASPKDDLTIGQKEQMEKVEKKLKALKSSVSGNVFKFKFMPVNRHYMTIDL